MERERVAIFIDGSNLYHNLKRYKIKTNFENIIKKLERKREVIGVFYYTALLDRSFDEEKYEKHKRFLCNLRELPNFNVILCNLRKVVLENKKVDFVIKGDDVHLAVDLVSRAYDNLYDVAIIVSGDADFVPAIRIAQKKGKKVINAFFPKSSSYILRNCCNGSINLKKSLL